MNNEAAATHSEKDTSSSKTIDINYVRNEELRLIIEKRKKLEVHKPESKPSSRSSQKEQEISLDQINDDAWKNKLVGLSFSGGGIRSATFNLGILQSLAKHHLLQKIDYLSTVSGGGYIGGWFTAMLQREHHRIQMDNASSSTDKEQSVSLEENTNEAKTNAIDVVEQRLQPDFFNHHKEAAPEDPAITHLRSFSNYLTPKLGFFSGDTWALVNTYLRNLILIQLILAIAIAGVLLIPRVTVDTISAFRLAQYDSPFSLSSIIVIIIFTIIASWFLGRNLAAIDDDDPAKPNPYSAIGLSISIVIPIFIACFLLAADIKEIQRAIASAIFFEPSSTASSDFLSMVALAIISYLIVWFIAMISAAYAYQSGWLTAGNNLKTRHRLQQWRGIIISGLFSAAIILGPGLYLIHQYIILSDSITPETVIWLAPPLIIILIVFTEVVHIGLASQSLRSHQREWLSRLGAWLFLAASVWLIISSITLCSRMILENIDIQDSLSGFIASGWLMTVVAGLFAGQHQDKPSWITKALVAISPYVFIIGLVILIATGLHFVLKAIPSLNISIGFFTIPESLLLSIVLLLVGAFLSWRFDINEFSLHKMYENRLARCFLGASTECRYPNPFTGFSLQDDIPLWIKEKQQNEKPNGKFLLGLNQKNLDSYYGCKDIKDEKNPENFYAEYPGPYPLVNTAISLVKGKRLAWQERKAAAFLFSPLYCGFQLSQRSKDDNRCQKAKCNFCIRPSISDLKGLPTDKKLYENCPCPNRYLNSQNQDIQNDSIKEKILSKIASIIKKLNPISCEEQELKGYYKPTKDFAAKPEKLTFGDVIATSGAAVSSNMGYHTTPAYSFLATMFNMRLGRWIGNPMLNKWCRSAPHFALWHLVKEVFGITNEKSKFVYLSDGGHFENLGIYELVRRHCRYIIACDAGADPDYQFEDLANAIRKCRIDFGVEIKIDLSEIKHINNNQCNTTPCAVGKIYYPKGKIGTLLYIKASKISDIPADVEQYATKHRDFPHQTTADQFFSESQFESYRKLGLYIGEHCLKHDIEFLKKQGKDNTGNSKPSNTNIDDLFRLLHQRWYKRSDAVQENFSNLTESLDLLFQQLRTTKELKFLDRQFYPEWSVLENKLTVTPTCKDDLSAGMFVLPENEEELRAGFYFCNSLIQLIENVYHDLNLEDEHNHPDNTGWLNIFNHWGWSGMFRVTWAISASTYGRRFRRYCEQHLNFGSWDNYSVSINHKYQVEKISNKSKITWENFKETKTPKSKCQNHELNQTQKNTLNILEKWQIIKILESSEQLEDSNYFVYPITFNVNKPEIFQNNHNKNCHLLSFIFAYALVRENKGHLQLIMFRVQDHLRNMGLGRRGLIELINICEKKLCLYTGDHKDESSTFIKETLKRVELINEISTKQQLHRFEETFNSLFSKPF